jgi:hypothetical protein
MRVANQGRLNRKKRKSVRAEPALRANLRPRPGQALRDSGALNSSDSAGGPFGLVGRAGRCAAGSAPSDFAGLEGLNRALAVFSIGAPLQSGGWASRWLRSRRWCCRS